MTERRQGAWIALNVVRARLTVVGFNLAMIALQLVALHRVPGGVWLPVVDAPVHFYSIAALLMGFGLSILAIVSFIASIELDKDGECTRWTLLAGDLFMYLALAHTVSSFFSPLTQTLDHMSLPAPNQLAELTTVRTAVAVTGGLAWFGVMYVGPAASLLLSPFGRRITAALGVAYVACLIAFAHVGAQAMRLERLRSGAEPNAKDTLLMELVQPFRW